MNPLYFQLASATCAGAAIGLLSATQWFGGRLQKHDKALEDMCNLADKYYHEINDLTDVVRSQEATLSRYHRTMGKPSETDPATTEMCGGCGAYLSQEEIAACAGEICPRFAEQALPQLSFAWDPVAGTFGTGTLK